MTVFSNFSLSLVYHVFFHPRDFIIFFKCNPTIVWPKLIQILSVKSLVLIWIHKEDFCGMEKKLSQSKEILSKGTSYMIERDQF